MKNLKEIKKIHCVGIGGIGLSGLARWFLIDNKEVSGSDLSSNLILDRLNEEGIKVSVGSQSTMPADTDLLIRSEAVPETDPTVEIAKHNKIDTMTYAEALGMVSLDKKAVAVSGTNGKSTATSFLAQMLIAADLDPSIIVGTLLSILPMGNTRHGDSDIFLLEADEYHEHMLEIIPSLAIITNIELDHLDYYRDIDHIRSSFQKFVNQVKKNGTVVLNIDDPESSKLSIPDEVDKITYGFGEDADIRAVDRKVDDGLQIFKVNMRGQEMCEVKFPVPGKHNVYNALAALAAALTLGVPFDTASQTLNNIQGSARRFEILGDLKGAPVVTDYAHHPTSVKSFLTGARELYPNRRIICVFEPHQHNRTRMLFDDFAKSFNDADVAIITEIFDVAGREKEEDQIIESKDLVQAINDAGHGNVHYAEDLDSAADMVKEIIDSNDLVLMVGAGNIHLTAQELVS